MTLEEEYQALYDLIDSDIIAEDEIFTVKDLMRMFSMDIKFLDLAVIKQRHNNFVSYIVLFPNTKITIVFTKDMKAFMEIETLNPWRSILRIERSLKKQ
jgi:hypothetical protein